MTAGSLSLMGNLGPKTPISGHSPETYFLPYPNTYRCPFGVGDRMGEEISLRYIDNVLADPESGITKPAMIIVEAIQGEGGCIPASSFWLKGLREITRRHDVPLVIDEVQTGLARTGNMFAFEMADIVPDAVILSKAVGGGFPLALVAYADRYDTWAPGAHAGTFRGNQIAFASGAATLQFLRDNDIATEAAGKGELFKECLRDLAAKYPVIGDIRGRGLMLGIEIVNPDGQPDAQGRPPADGALTRRIKQACLDEGVIVESGGRHSAVLRLLPPLIITPDEIETVVSRLDLAISRVLAEAMAA
jgi:diaminobutyrate-2-oxoglutarate transaminase